MRSVSRQSFDRRDRSIDRRDLRLAGPSGLSTDVDGTSAALSDAAPELRPLHIENISQHPQKGHVWRNVNRFGLPIYSDFVGHIIISLSKGLNPVQSRRLSSKWRLLKSFALPGIYLATSG